MQTVGILFGLMFCILGIYKIYRIQKRKQNSYLTTIKDLQQCTVLLILGVLIFGISII